MNASPKVVVKWRDYVKEIPLFGGLVDCDVRDHYEAAGQTFIILLLSTTPIWLGALVVYGTGNQTGIEAFKTALYSPVMKGELFMYCTTLLAPIFWIALVDPPGARIFPSKVSHMVLIGIIDLIAAVFFGLIVAGKQLRGEFTFSMSKYLFVVSVILLYLGTVYHTSRLPPSASERFKQDEAEFSAAVGEQRHGS